MTHFDIWIIVGTCSLCTTLGVYVIITKVIRYTPTPVNTLVRRGDVELQEITHPINVRDIDLSSLPQYPQVMVNNPNPIRWEYPPRYSELSNNLINCSLENNINLDYIFIVIVFFLILILIWKLIYNSK